MAAQIEPVAEKLRHSDRQILVQVRSIVGVHDKRLVAGPVPAKLKNPALRYEEVRCIQEPGQGLNIGV